MPTPFLNWAGKAERLAFNVFTMPLFVYDRLITRTVIEALKVNGNGMEQMHLFAGEKHSIAEQVLKAYGHRDQWVNRIILGDSLVVMIGCAVNR